jgi:hypothetical protein
MGKFTTVLFLVLFILVLIVGNLLVFYPEQLRLNFEKEESVKSVYRDSKYEPSYVKDDLQNGVGNLVYVMPYVGDIDGDVSDDWNYFFDILTTFHEEERIPSTFSFYPASIDTQSSYIDILLRMYESDYIELMQKEYIEEDLESGIEDLPSDLKIEIRRGILESEKEHFIKIMRRNGYKNIELPISYTQLGGRITEDDRRALELSGIKVYFDVYYNDEIGPISSTENFDVMQYGVGFTRDGSAGALTQFRSADEIMVELSNYERLDVEMISFDGLLIVPLWVHQQDFEKYDGSSEVDLDKWQVYTETLLRLKQDPNVRFITPKEMYYLRHGMNDNKLRL